MACTRESKNANTVAVGTLETGHFRKLFRWLQTSRLHQNPSTQSNFEMTRHSLNLFQLWYPSESGHAYILQLKETVLKSLTTNWTANCGLSSYAMPGQCDARPNGGDASNHDNLRWKGDPAEENHLFSGLMDWLTTAIEGNFQISYFWDTLHSPGLAMSSLPYLSALEHTDVLQSPGSYFLYTQRPLFSHLMNTQSAV